VLSVLLSVGIFFSILIISKENITINIFKIGAPADVVNVRMQNDCKLPMEQRRNYKHAFDGLIRIYHEEGPRTLFNGIIKLTKKPVL